MQEEILGNPSLCDRQKLREERRARNKLKRQHKKEEKRRKNVDAESEKINKGVAIVSQDFAEKFKKKLEETEINKLDRKHPIVLNIDVEDKRNENCNSTYVTDISDIKSTDKNIKGKKEEHFLGGNRLDSSQPIRSTGKHREIQKPKKLSRLKRNLVANKQISSNANETYIDYCDNWITENLEKYCELFITRVVELQEKLYKRDPHKGDYKRRYFVGFQEVKKYLAANKIKVLIIAKDLKIFKENDPLHATIKEITSLADHFMIPCVFALKRRKIGALTLKFLPISCIGVRDYDGANDEFRNVIEELMTLKKIPIEFTVTPSDTVNQPFLERLKEELVIK